MTISIKFKILMSIIARYYNLQALFFKLITYHKLKKNTSGFFKIEYTAVLSKLKKALVTCI